MFIYLDTETTGNGPDDRLCQIAYKPDKKTPSVGHMIVAAFNL